MPHKDPDKHRAYMREWKRRNRKRTYPRTEQQREKARARNRRYRERHKTELADKQRKSRTTNRAMHRARELVAYAVRTGQLVKPDKCSRADESCRGRIEAHHASYDEPLNVEWLCVHHHRNL